MSPAYAAATVAVRGGEHDTYDRLVFDWSGKNAPQLTKDNETDFTLTFDSAAAANLPKSLSKLKRLGTITQTSADPLTIALHVNPGNTIKLSRAGSKVVADIQKGNSQTIPQTAAAATPMTDAVTSAAPADKKNPLQTDDWSENQELADKPPAKNIDAKAAPKTDDKKNAAAKTEAGPTGPGGRPLTIAELADQEKQDAAKPAAAAPAVATDDDEGPLTPVPNEPPLPPVVTTIKLAAPEDAKFAAFMRGQSFWLAFDSKIVAMPTEKDQSTPTTFGPVSRYPVNNGEGVIYRIALAPGQFAALTGYDDKGLTFSVYRVAPIVLPPALPVANVVDKKGKNTVQIKMHDAGTPLTIKDPEVGDDLTIIPAPAVTGGTTTAIHYPQFDILSTLNGAVIKNLTDGIDVTTSKTEATIARHPQNLAVTVVNNASGQAAEQIFDLKHWVHGNPSDYRHINYTYETQLAETRGPDRLNKIMTLAQFQFAAGYGREAQGWLDIAAQEFPAVVNVPQYILLRGAVHALKREFVPADADLSLDGYATEPEVALWRGYIAAERGDYERARYFFHLAGPLIYDYPDPYGRLFAMDAAETAVETGDSITAQSLIAQTRHRPGLSKADSGQLDYLAATNAALNGDEAAAKKFWDKAIAGGNALYANKSRYKMVVQGLAKKTLKPVDAVKTLDDLCMDWRGDNLELAALMLLANLEIDTNQPRRAFEAWQTVINNFPNKAEAETAQQLIAQNFAKLFAADNQDAVPPIVALGLYRDFIDYAPKNDTTNQITQTLINRLAGLELYKDAADLTHTEVDQLNSPAREQAILQMAKYLLLDDQPQAMRDALAPLDATKLAAADQAAYRMLLARADFQDKKYDSALTQLGTLDDDNARRLKADIYWKSQDWNSYVKLAPALIGKLADDKLSPVQARIVLQQAVALAMLQDQPNLEALRNSYSAKMDVTQLAASFRLITRPPKGSEVQSLAAIKGQLGEVDMFKDFLAGPTPAAAADTKTVPPAATPPADTAKTP